MKLHTLLGAAGALSAVSFLLASSCTNSPELGTPGDGEGGSGAGSNIDVGGGGEGGALSGDGKNCGGTAVEAAPAQVNVLLVVDRSGSMTGKPAGFTDSKWNTLKGAFSTALPEVAELISLGLKLYPTGNSGDFNETGQCNVNPGVELSIAPGQDSATAISSELDKTSSSPAGMTPTAKALGDALTYFTSGDGQALEGTNYVLLATDGGPNCGSDASCVFKGDPFTEGQTEAASCTLNIDNNCAPLPSCPPGSVCTAAYQCLDDDASVSAISALDAAGIKTIVVGMPGSEAYQATLDAMAVAGKLPASSTSPRYHKVTDSAGLTATLRDITRTVIRSCEIQLPSVPPDKSKVNVFLDGEVIPKDDTTGWKYDLTVEPPVVLLTGDVCAHVEQVGVESISVEFGCQTVILR